MNAAAAAKAQGWPEGMGVAALYVVGLGPGSEECLTPLAVRALSESACIAGYARYVALVPEALRAGKRIVSNGMRQEEERCAAAVESALSGTPTALVCSGDPGIYALAGLALEQLEARGLLETLPLEIVPGVPALCASAALLGAPLMHDFACVSLSDLLTPWETIERRLRAAFAADFVVALYNPRSRGRDWQLDRALKLARAERAPACPVGIVRNACREGQRVRVTTLEAVCSPEVDMLSLVIVGNSETRRMGRYMATPRGYAARRMREKTPCEKLRGC